MTLNIRGLLITLVLALGATFSVQALTPAGVIINNQATATYKDSNLDIQSTSSNIVQTLVKEVIGVILTTPLTKAVVEDAIFYFPHFLTNTGNGPESYTLCIDQSFFVGSDDFDFDNLELFADADTDGLPDSGTPYATVSIPVVGVTPVAASDGCFQIPALSGGDAIQIVVAATITDRVTDLLVGDIANYALSAYADSDTSVNGQNTDEGFITDQPIIEVLKSISENSGISPSGPYTVTLTYRNIGSTAGQNLEITEILPVDTFPTPLRAAGMTYVVGSAEWAHDGAAGVVLTDTSFTPQVSGTSTAVFCSYDAACNAGGSPFGDDRMAIRVASIAAGETGTITFDVDIESGLLDSDVLRNVVQYAYESTDAIPVAIPLAGTLDSNAVTFVIINAVTAPDVVANDSAIDKTLGADDSDNTNNIVSVASIPQGSSVLLENYIWNTGDGIDSFDITLDEVLDREGNPLANVFPPGTIFGLFKADGIAPLLDTNGNSTPDTGPMNPDDVLKIVVKITPLTSLSGDNSGNGWDVTKIATSFSNSSISNAVTDRIASIDPSIVDLTNTQIYDTDCVDGTGLATPGAGGCGSYSGEGYPNGEVAAVTTFNVDLDDSVWIPLWVQNIGPASDNFTLGYSSSNYSDGVLPAGWSVRFHDSNGGADCSNPGNIITTTGAIASLSQFLACAKVSVDDTPIATGIAQSLFFRVLSATTGAYDIKHDAVLINQVPLLAIEPFHWGQISANETIDYQHIVSNYGNTQIECINITLVDELLGDGWTSLVYLDVDEDATFSGADVLLTDQTLLSGEQFKIIVRVTSPVAVDPDDVNHTTVTVNGQVDDNDANPAICIGAALSDVVEDDTRVSPTALEIVKSQAPDTDCDSFADSAFVVTEFQVTPGDCVIYQLVATNHGALTAYTVVVNDDTPEFTVYNASAESCAAVGGTPSNCSPPSSEPTNGDAGIITWTLTELLSGGTVTATFGVQVE